MREAVQQLTEFRQMFELVNSVVILSNLNVYEEGVIRAVRIVVSAIW